MILRNLTKKYIVMQEYMSGEHVRQYLCYEADDPHNRLYSAVCQNLSDVRSEEIYFLTELLKEDKFTDLVDYFVNGEQFFILFRYRREDTLQQRIAAENCQLTERLEIAKKILEKTLLLHLPDYFFYGAMGMDLIHVSKDGEIYFTYDCRKIREFDSFGFQDGAKALANILDCIFLEEIKQRSIPELFRLVYDLRHGGVSSCLEIYERYWEIYQQYFGKQEDELEPYHWTFRVWDKIKKIGSILKKFVWPALLLLAVIYLIISIAGLFAEPGIHDNFKSIGTMEITQQEDMEETEETTDTEKSEEPAEESDESGVQ